MELTTPQWVIVVVFVVVWGPIVVAAALGAILVFWADREPGETEDARLAREQLEWQRTQKHGPRKAEDTSDQEEQTGDKCGTGRPRDAVD